MAKVQVSTVNRLVVCDAVAREVELLHSVLDLLSDLVGVPGLWVQRESRPNRWYPQRGQVSLMAQVSPEPEVQLGNDLAIDLGPMTLSGTIASASDGLAHRFVLLAVKQVALLRPGAFPAVDHSVFDDRVGDDVPENHFETTDVLVYRCACPDVPVVETQRFSKVSTGLRKVRTESLSREASSNCLVVDA